MRSIFLLPLLALFTILPTVAQDKKVPAPTKEPHVLLSMPLGAIPGKSTNLILRGANLAQATEVKLVGGQGSAKILKKGGAPIVDKNPERLGNTFVEVALNLDAAFMREAVELIVVAPTGASKPFAVLVETKLPVVAEREPNHGFATAHALTLPVVVDGAIAGSSDVDVFRFEGKKGQRVVAEVMASRRNSLLDAVLTLYDAKFRQLATNDDFDRSHRDAKIDMTLPADGEYYLSLVDAHGSGSPPHVYRLVIK